MDLEDVFLLRNTVATIYTVATVHTVAAAAAVVAATILRPLQEVGCIFQGTFLRKNDFAKMKNSKKYIQHPKKTLIISPRLPCTTFCHRNLLEKNRANPLFLVSHAQMCLVQESSYRTA